MMILVYLESIGSWVRLALTNLGFSVRFLGRTLISFQDIYTRSFLLRQQIFQLGVLSFLIIIVAGWFVGMVLGLQGYNTLVRFGASEALGALVALSLLRELGPVLAAILFASRAGTAITSEIALMKTTDQLNALEVMGIDSMARIVAPRFFGGLISLPILTLIFNTAGILGAYGIGVFLVGLDKASFWTQMQSAVTWKEDVLNGIIKSIVFAGAVSWVAVYQGMQSTTTAEGIASATTRTVVIGSLIILALDFLLTAWMF
jgi:phospholipid/cholesterol/gamma-HCH transport system permease protein